MIEEKMQNDLITLQSVSSVYVFGVFPEKISIL